MAIAVDTSVAGSSGSSSSFALPALSTAGTNEIIMVFVETNGGPVTSISDTASLTWTFLKNQDDGNAGEKMEMWYAKAAAQLSSDVITVNTTSAAFITACAVAISGANFSSPFDSNAAIPTSHDNSNHLTFTTSNANDLLIAGGRSGGQAPDAPYTTIYAANFLSVGYVIVSTTQSSGSDFSVNGGSSTWAVGTALVQDTGGGGTTPWVPNAMDAIRQRSVVLA
jgi:hypothetical protein